MVAIAEGIDHHDPDASKFFHILLIDGLGVGDIGKIADTERGDRIGTMHHSDRHDFKSVDTEGAVVKATDVEGGYTWIRIFLKAVVITFAEVSLDIGGGINGKVADSAIRAQVVDTSDMVVMAMRQEHGIDMADIGGEGLLTEVGRDIDQDGLAHGADERRGAGTFIINKRRGAYRALATDLGDTLGSTCAEHSDMNLRIDIIDLRGKIDEELAAYGIADLLSESGDIVSGGIAGIDYDEGLAIIDSSSAIFSALHAGVVYKPSGREFDMHLPHRVSGEFMSGQRLNLAELATMHDRVLEETAGTADQSRVGKFGIADTLHLFSHFADGGIMAEGIAKGSEGTIVEMTCTSIGSQSERDTQHDITVLALMLEETVAIAEAALLGRELDNITSKQVEALHREDDITCLDSVGTYILHRRGSDLTRDSGEVFNPGESLIESPVDEIGPLLPCPDYGVCLMIILVIAHHATDIGMKHQAIESIEKEKIAATSYMEDRAMDESHITREFEQFIG